MNYNSSINFFPYIELTITCPGNRSVFFENNKTIYIKGYQPTIFLSNVYINNIKQENKNSEYYLNKTENIVKLEYNNTLDLRCYFHLCSNITKIDFSNFNFSILSSNNIGGMFNGCTSLTSVNFANFNISEIEQIHLIFYNYRSLISVNLSNFYFSNVIRMESMFD